MAGGKRYVVFALKDDLHTPLPYKNTVLPFTRKFMMLY